MEEGSAISDADSDETIVEGSVAESDLEEEEHRGQRLSLLCKNITLATENGIAAEIGNISEEKLSPEIEFICKHSINLQIPGLTDLINLLNQERNKMVGSQSLLQAGINCPVIAMDICQLDCPRAATAHGEDEHFICLDSEVPGFPETSDRNFPEPLNDEDSPEISLLSGMDVIKAPSNNSILQRTEMSEIFQSVNKEDMTENTLETMTSSITSNKIMAVKSEDLMEPLSDSETLQMLDMLEYQNDAIPTDTSVNKESNALPVELLTALNSLSESVAASLCLPADKGSRYITTEKEPTPDQTEDGCTQITDTHLKPQLLLKHLEGIEALTMTTLPHPSEEQIDCNQNMHQLNCSDHQNMSSHDTPAKKANSILNNASSHEQTVNVTSYTKRKSARKRKEFTLNDVDAASNCHQFLEGMQQKIHSYETRTRTSAKVFESNIQDKANECSQMGTGSCHFSSEDVNTKVEQVRKSQRIAKKRRQATSKNCSNDSSRNYISLSKINRRDIFGQTLLHRAAMKGDLDDICAMIKAGANVNAQDYAGWTPLHEASVAGFFEATNEFLKAGAGVNCKGSEQVTPLHDAVKEGHYKVAELLLWYGADPLLKNERGKSPLEEAAADRHMRKLLESCIAKSRRSASAERLVESPSSDQSRMESHPKVKRSSGESIQHSTVEKTKILKQHSVKLEQNKKKGTPQSNFASRLHNRCSPLNATTFEGTCLASKAKQSVREGPPSFWGTSSDKRRINGQRKGIHDGLSNSLSFPEGIVGSSGYNQYNSNRTCDTGEECSMAVGSEIQQESDFNNSDNDCLSERKEPLKSSELAGTTKDQVTNSCVVTSLNLVDKSTLPSETEIVNEPNIDFTHLLCKDIRLPLQEERQCAMKPSSGSPCFKVGTLGDNLHTNEMMLVWTVREAINPAYNKNRPPVQYLHSESSVDQVNLDCHRNVVLEHELSVKEPVTEPIYLEENPLEAKSTTTTLMQEIAHLSDSDYTVLSGEYTLNADQNSDTNTFRAAGICHEQTVHVSIEISSTFSQGINRVDVSESPDTYSVSEQRFLTPPVHEGIMMGPRTEGNVGRCCLERTENGGRMDNNTFLPLQMLDKNPFQDKSLQTEILGRCYSEKSEKENSNIIPLQVNELETIQSKIMEGKINENYTTAGAQMCILAYPSQFNPTEELQIPHALAGRELCNSRSRKIHSCCDCSEKDNSVSQPNSSRQSCDTHESINELLHDIEDKQDRLLLFELRSQRDADLYIQDLSQIQNILNALLAKQKSERDALAKKYRTSVECFKQGALREQIAKLVSRQKSLLLMAQKQKALGRKIQNYKNAKKESSSKAKHLLSTLIPCEGNNTEDGASGKTALCPDVVVSLETSRIRDNIFLDQESSQYPNRSLNMSGGNGKGIRGEKVDLEDLVSENNLRENSTEEVTKITHSKSSDTIVQATLSSEPVGCFTQQIYLEDTDCISVALQRNKPLRVCTLNSSATGSIVNNNINQRTTESQYVCTNEPLQQCSNISEDLQIQPELASTDSYLAIHQKNIPNNQISLNANLEPTRLFSHALLQNSSNSSPCSNSQNSEKQLNFKANRREKNQLLHLLELGKIKPGDDVLEFTLQDSKHKASLLGNGKVKTGNNSVYQNLVQWIKALLGNDISVNWKYAYSKVTYSGTLLSKIIAEVHVSKELELQQKKLFGRNSTGCDYSRGVAELCCCSHKTSSSQDVDNIQQKVAPFSQEMEILPSSETEADEIMPEVSEIKASYHFNSSARPRRFLQFNSRALIKDEEFMPGHIMDQYWNFYVHCKNFGF